MRLVGGATADAVIERDWLLSFPVDVRVTLGVQGRGRGDPTYRLDESGAIWRTSLTPDGPATIRVLPAARKPAGLAGVAGVGKVAGLGEVARLSGVAGDGGGNGSAEVRGTAPGASVVAVGGCTRVRAQAWGPGADWLLDALPGALGLYDDDAGFDPSAHPLIRDSARSNPGFRLGRSGRLMEALVPAILEQKVVILEAHRAWRILLSKYGTQPPGPAPAGMRVFPEPRVWRRIPSWDWHRAGVEGVRAETIIRACTVAGSLERLLTLSHEEADRKLQTIPGIGIWTSAEARQRAAGDPDAVSVGDYHLKNIVGWALAGKDRSTDEEMLALLEPFKGHRHRATRLIGLSGNTRSPGPARYGPRTRAPQRRGPRMSVRDYRSF
jgi:3-methyladenine DNA glycosylase/8-oxoguanine DNA glycosylase